MDYERDNYLRATTNLDANMQQQQQHHHQQQQQELQQKIQLQQQQQQLEQQQHQQQQQPQQQQHLHMPADYHQLHQQHLQQQMHQHHLYLQQQHQQHQHNMEQNNHHAQQQLQHNTHLQQQQQHHHHQQQMLLHQQEMLRIHVEQQQQQQQQQQHLNPAITTTLTPNYANSNTTTTAATTTIPSTVTTTLATMQQQLTQDAQSVELRKTPTTTTSTDDKTIQQTQAATTTTSMQNEMHYAALQQQQQHHQQLQHQYAATNDNNKTDSSISAFTSSNTNNNNNNNNHNNNSSNITNNCNNSLENGINSAPMDYNKYYQQFITPATHLQTVATTTTATEATVTTTNTPAAATSNPNSYMLDTTANTTTATTINESDQTSNDSLKRKHENEMDDSAEAKKALEDKKNLIVNMRKNIRDVMDETQLDTNTLAAQREESERLARVAEQQKAMREYQRQTAVNRQFVRTQNRVMSLLQSGKTYAKFTEEPAALQLADNVKKEPELSPGLQESISHEKEPIDSAIDEEHSKSPESSKTESEQPAAGDVVTIEDSSSEDDCILLSDDDDEDLMDEEVEDDPHNSGLHVQDSYNVPDEQGRVVVNVGHPEGEEDIYVAPQIAKTIKPHQIGGVRFLFDNIIESIKRFKHSSGFGCILAHSMGLGKTLQVVCFCDIFLRHTNSKTVLCVMPINTLQNWVNEFNMWTPRQSADPTVVRPRHFDVYVLNDQHKTLSARAKVILRWAEQGGVLLIGYELFRLLAMKIIPQRKRRGQKQFVAENTSSETHKRLTESIYQALVKPGPDLVICDEGHRIKNAHAGISMALKQIRTRRRIVLTGYPLQNNLLEYWCMVDFVRPNYLGNRTEFCNMFERPIQNGQCIDSTPEDIKLMRYRAHVLHSLLVGFVQRRSHMVLQQTLPQKLEYVILTRMTTFQRQLYDIFMNDVVRTRTVPNPLKAFSVCCKIWNHPDVLYNFLKRYEHDLDIEIEEGEIVPDTPPTPTTLASLPATPVTPNSAIETTEGGATPSSVVSATLVDESQTSSSGFSSMTAPTPTPTLPASEQNSTSKTASAEAYDNMHFSTHSSVNAGVSADCNGNNYWLEPNLPYYTPYQQVLPSQNAVPQPDYVGIVKPRPGAAGEHTSSSEIVDLDTKEIKTVETDLDLERNTLIKTESITSTKANKTTTANSTAKSQNKQLAVTNADDKTSDEAIKHTERDTSRWADGVPYDWALDLMKKYEPDLIENSPKMEVFFCILHQSIKLNDRVLLFSQSLLTLNLIERFLQANYVPGTESYWARNVSYFRLDGSTNSQEREKLVNEFNSNHNVKLFLISTRAGSLGINLVGANRVVVFDASWNPCHDTQAVYRIYRYGQQKACYVYRIVMDRCLEKKIYDRQIKKQGMSDRVVDECNPDAHLSLKDVTNLCHDYDDDNKAQIDAENFKTPIANYVDDVIKKVILNYKGCLSKEPFFHESLLIDRKEKKLSQAEKRQAHRGYEMEKKASIRQTINHTTSSKIQYRIIRNDGVSVTRPVTTQNTRNTNIRTTRWIPAEVWQRQGMTAQEMTLPLDVVIPTNSSDKSNIILKAGQRVMVLKSAKGIYMQLDSGKIIAIRTSSKATDGASTSKAAETKSNEVIDITADGDNASNQTSSSNSSNNSNSNTSATSTTISNTALNPDSKLDSNYNSNNNSLLSSSNINAAAKINKATTHLTAKDAKHKTDAFMNNGMTAKYDALNKNNSPQKSKEITSAFSQQQQQQHHASLSSAAATTTNKKPVQKIEITSNERLPPIKPFSTSIYNSTAITPTHSNMTDSIYDNEQKYNNRKPQVLQQQKQQQQQQSNDKLSTPQQQQQKHKMHQQNSTYGNANVNSNHQSHTAHHHQQSTKSLTYVDYEQQLDMYANKAHQSVHNEPRQTDKVDNTHYTTAYGQQQPHQQQQQQQQQQLSPTNTRTNDGSNNAYETQKNNHNTSYKSAQQQKQQTTTAATSKNKIKTASTECFQNPSMYTTKLQHAENDAHQSKAAVVATTTSSTAATHTSKSSNEYTPAATTATQHMVADNGTYGKPSAEILPTYAQYSTPVAQQQQAAATPTPQQQQQLAQQQQQAAKMRLYMPQFSMPQSHAHSNYANAVPPATAPPPPTSVATSAAAAAPPPPPTVLPSTYPKAMPNYSQYYESMYDCSNNMAAVEYAAPTPPHPPPPTAAGYPDYSAAYHHAPYHTNFQPNTYGCATLSAPVRGPPYMHWSPLVTSASLAEHHAAANSIFSTANYANDAAAAAAAAAAQANQWHHQ